MQTLPAYQRTVGSLRHRAQRQAECHRVKSYRYAVSQTDAWVALCTSHPTWHAAVCRYRRRWSIEGSYRDAQSGWDGQHGWDLEPVLAQARSAAHAERVVGLWALGSLIQTWIGAQVVQGPPAVQAVATQWTTTGRLSVWAHGQLALHEPSGALRPWLIRLALAVDERAGRAFVVSQLGVGRGGLIRDRGSVTVLDATTGSILQTMAVSKGASAIAIDEQTKRAFVASPTDGTVTMIDIAHA